jgi:hypothetical protein
MHVQAYWKMCDVAKAASVIGRTSASVKLMWSNSMDVWLP